MSALRLPVHTNDRYILKCISSGVTDPLGIINSIKKKRKDLDYNSREDLTFIFVDDDCDYEKRKKIETLKTKMTKDTVIVKSRIISLHKAEREN